MVTTDDGKKLIPVIVTVRAGEFTNPPGGQMPPAEIAGLPALTFNVTSTATLLLAALEDENVILPIYAPGANPAVSTETVSVPGRPTRAMLADGETFNQAPPATVMEAVSARPEVI